MFSNTKEHQCPVCNLAARGLKNDMEIPNKRVVYTVRRKEVATSTC